MPQFYTVRGDQRDQSLSLAHRVTYSPVYVIRHVERRKMKREKLTLRVYAPDTLIAALETAEEDQ